MIRLGLLAVLVVALAAPPAEAVAPGEAGPIVFGRPVDGVQQAFLVDPDGAPVVQLTREPRSALSPTWSPDGRRIAYLTPAESSGLRRAQVPGAPARALRLVIVNADGSGRRVVANVLAPLGRAHVKWSPDGARFLFTGPGSGSDDGDVWVVNADGSGARSLTNDPSGEDEEAEWSPDGTRIVFGHTSQSGLTFNSTVRVMNADGSGQVILAGPFTNQIPGDLSWAPGGGRIVYERDGPGNPGDVFALDPDGSNQTQITTAGESLNPAWSPDGSRIAFSSDRDGPGFSVYTMNPDGSGVSRVTTGRDDFVTGWGAGGLLADQSVSAKVVSGVVSVRPPGGRRFARFGGSGNIPYGSVVDTHRGRIRITADGGGTAIDRVDFYAGVFKLVRRPGARPLTEAVLAGRLQGCRGSRGAARAARHRSGRLLWASGKGRIRIRGRLSSATTARGTWTVEDRCDGSTFTRVARGRARVRDFARRRTVTLGRGRSYVARRQAG